MKAKSPIELSIDALPVLGKRRYIIKSEVLPENFLKVTTFLRKCIKAEIAVPIDYFAAHIGVAPNTARKWLQLTVENLNYDPAYDCSNRSMSDRLEDTIMAVFEDEFLLKNYFFNNQILKSLALHAWEFADPEDKLKSSFQASDGWCKDFRHRHQYVWRKSHLKHRPTQDAMFPALLEDFTETVRKLTKSTKMQGQAFC
jgi:hypothetical protein